MDFPEKLINYILDIYSKKDFSITKNQQRYDAVGYYIMIGYLKKEGMVFQNGLREGQKIWRLTPRGMKVAELLKQLKKEVDVIFEGTTEDGRVIENKIFKKEMRIGK